MKRIQIITGTESISLDFILPPPLLPSENAKSLNEWFKNTRRLCDSSNSKSIYVFKIYRTIDHYYAIYLTLAIHSEDMDGQFVFLKHIGNSFKIPEADSKEIKPEEIILRISSEFLVFFKSSKLVNCVFEKAELVMLTYDSYHYTNLIPK